jgi:hypothetical protein
VQDARLNNRKQKRKGALREAALKALRSVTVSDGSAGKLAQHKSQGGIDTTLIREIFNRYDADQSNSIGVCVCVLGCLLTWTANMC